MSQLKELRQKYGYDSINSLAEEAGVSWDTIRRIEEGIEESPKYETLQKIADALGRGVSPDDIMED